MKEQEAKPAKATKRASKGGLKVTECQHPPSDLVAVKAFPQPGKELLEKVLKLKTFEYLHIPALFPGLGDEPVILFVDNKLTRREGTPTEEVEMNLTASYFGIKMAEFHIEKTMVGGVKWTQH